MNKEYTRYVFIQDLLLKLSTSFLSEDYKTKNLIEQWVIELANKEISAGNYNFLEIKTKDLDLSKEYKILSERKYGLPAEKVINIIKYLHNRYIMQLKTPQNFDVKYTYKNGIFKCLNYSRVVPEARYNKLLEYADKDKIAHMIMRYAVIISSSQHWAIPNYIYKRFIKDIGINFEAFASPLNSQMLMLSFSETSFGKETKQVSGKGIYGSLFYDTDKYFGSAGSFFNLPYEFFIGRKVVVNPPFTYAIVEKSINFCYEILFSLTNEFVRDLDKGLDKEKGTLFLFSLPIWAKEYTKKLKSLPFFHLEEHNECEFENTDGEIIKNKTGTIWFIIANYKLESKIKIL